MNFDKFLFVLCACGIITLPGLERDSPESLSLSLSLSLMPLEQEVQSIADDQPDSPADFASSAYGGTSMMQFCHPIHCWYLTHERFL